MRRVTAGLAVSILVISSVCCARIEVLPCGVVADKASRAAWVGRLVEVDVRIGSPAGMTYLYRMGGPIEKCYVPTTCAADGSSLHVLLGRQARFWYEKDYGLIGQPSYPQIEITTDDHKRLLEGDFMKVRGRVASNSTQEFFVDGTVDSAAVLAVPADREADAAAFYKNLYMFRIDLAKLLETPGSIESALDTAERALDARRAEFQAAYHDLRNLAPPRIHQATRSMLENLTTLDDLVPLVRLKGDRRIDRLKASYAAIFADSP